MANGTDAEEFVVLSKVRTGLKREFEFALKVQAEICGSLGRTRARKAQNGVPNNGVQGNSRSKRLKSCGLKEKEKEKEKEKKSSDLVVDVMSEEEAKSDVVDVDEGKSDLGPCVDMVVPIGEEVKRSEEGLVEAMIEDENERGYGQKREKNGEGEEKNEVEKAVLNDCGRELVNGVEEKGEKDLNDNLEEDKNAQLDEGSSKAVPILINGDCEVENLLNEKPYRRFTRSALKPKVQTKKISSVKNVVEGNDKLVVANVDDDVKVDDVVTPVKGEMDMSIKVARKFPAKLKDLFELGILEGVPVKYMRGSRGTRV